VIGSICGRQQSQGVKGVTFPDSLDKSYCTRQRRLLGGDIGGWAHYNDQNGIHGTESNMWFPYV
jgi:hypothetical protein